MEKKFEDDELNKWLDEQSMKEAELIEQALFSDDSFEDYEETDEELKASYQRLVERLKADGIYREEDDGQTGSSDSYGGNEADKEKEQSGGSHSIDTAAAEETGDKIVSLPVSDRTKEKRKAGRTYKIAKAAGFVVVGTLCVFAASMTSEANRTYFIDKFNYVMGDDTKILVDNDTKNEVASSDESEARDMIEKTLEVDVPRFFYRPDNFEFVQAKVNKFSSTASIEFQYKNSIIVLYIDKENEKNASKIDSLHGEDISTFLIDSENILVSIKEVKDIRDKEPSYSAQWERNGVIYVLSGKIERDVFIKMLEELTF